MSRSVVETKGLTRTFYQGGQVIEAVKPLDLIIKHGELVAIQGTSGSGKSTLLHLLALLDRPTGGSYFLDGTDTAQMSDNEQSDARNRLTGIVFQNFYLIPYATAAENVMLPGLYRRTPHPNIRRRAEELLDSVGLGDRINFKPSSLSGGQQQRVAIARAMFNNPPLLLADEPTGQLDTNTSNEILDLFGKINETGKTIIIVTHDPLTADSARRRIIFKDGEVQSDQKQVSVRRGTNTADSTT
ncbi:ABC transporter ATP-binding protein [Halodesulfovibrio marinisediminis]|uniref:Putative ABC transport system ATP-binding protein n=1 Tax=Halodesulfovibrio marinisediminis DSM 17456 TaxID=1121457 RepID=A0A1N6HI90_9BACT|nr:ABC transporter ATP-binding protein [Halodesulfovibrio marinisediminis]SIO19558.1 putative ABC transport system ATP-binding protein [Halodesulfovibrio marinisediminis DSM 17456]